MSFFIVDVEADGPIPELLTWYPDLSNDFRQVLVI